MTLCAGCYSGLNLGVQDAGTGGAQDDGAGDGGESDGTGGTGAAEEDPAELSPHYAQTGMRRLTPHEYDATVADLLGIQMRPSAEVLPLDLPEADADYPFDNDYESQAVSGVLIEAAQVLAEEAAAALVADIELRDAVVGCVPAGPDDAECMRSFIRSFGRRAFRRPLSEQDVNRFMNLQRCPQGGETERCGFATDEDDFYAGVQAVVSAMLVNPRFLYRIEDGTPVDDEDGVLRLDGFEVATRLSYLMWGSTPDDWLLDKADGLELDTVEQVRAVAAEMLTSDAARRQIGRFHAQWLGYEQLPHDELLRAGMLAETQALVDRVIFDEKRPWIEIFTAAETYVDAFMAEHYGLAHPGGSQAKWVPYGDSGRGGILSHGSFLFGGAVGDKTSPVTRGKRLITMALCQPIPSPPPEVEPPQSAEGTCKQEILESHANGTCASCHQFMDAIGFGLEAYDTLGRFREHEPDLPQCEISGAGEFPSLGEVSDTTPFQGPAELAELMVASGRVQECAATQLVRYGLGHNIRSAAPSAHVEDLEFVESLAEEFGKDGRFDTMLLNFVASKPFMHRKIPQEEA